MDEGIVILEETTPIRIEVFHHAVKVITQDNNVLLTWAQIPFTVGVKCSGMYRFLGLHHTCSGPEYGEG